MALEKQQLVIDITSGLDTSEDDKYLQPGSATLLENVRFEKNTLLGKKYGHTNRPLTSKVDTTDGTISSSTGLHANESDFLLESDNKLFSYTDHDSTWRSRGQIIPTKSVSKEIVRSTSQQSHVSMSEIGSLTCYAYRDSSVASTGMFNILDRDSGDWLEFGKQLSATGLDHIQVVALGTEFIFITSVSDSGNQRLEVQIYDTVAQTLNTRSNVESSTGVAIAADEDTSWYAKVRGSNVYILASDNGVSKTNLYEFSDITAPASDVLEIDSSAVTMESCYIALTSVTSVSRLTVLYTEGTDIKVFAVNDDFDGLISSGTQDATEPVSGNPYDRKISGAQSSPTVHDITLFSCASKNAGEQFAGGYKTACYTYENSSGTFASKWFVLSHLSIATEAFLINTKPHIGLYFKSETNDGVDLPLQSGTHIVDADLNYFGKFGENVSDSGFQVSQVFFTPSLIRGDNSVFCYQFSVENVFDGTSATPIFGVAEVELDYTQTKSLSSSSLVGTKYLSGSSVKVYDGIQLYEDSFAYFPEIRGLDDVVGATPSLPNGTYQYTSIYEWVDNLGNLHRSAPSVPKIHVKAADNGVQIGLSPLYFSDRALGSVRISIFRTKASGSIFYKAGEIFNDPSIVAVEYYDNILDADLINNEILYTQGGEIENTTLPHASIITTHQNRIFATGMEDPLVIRFSKETQFRLAPGFNESFEIRLESAGGRITALASLDKNLLIFKNRRLYFMTGDGPNNLGFGTFTEPQLLHSDLGAVDHNSVMTTPLGVVFKSERGFYLVNRQLGLDFFGDEIQDIDDVNVANIVVKAKDREIRIYTTGGDVLIKNYEHDRWSVSKESSMVGAATTGDLIAYAGSDGVVHVEDESTYLSNSVFQVMKVTTGWLNVANVQGLQRIYKAMILGNWKTPHSLVMKVSYDFDDSVVQTITFDAGTDPTDYQWETRFGRQKCTSVKISIEDAAHATEAVGTGQGAELNTLQLRVGVKPKGNTLPMTRRS